MRFLPRFSGYKSGHYSGDGNKVALNYNSILQLISENVIINFEKFYFPSKKNSIIFKINPLKLLKYQARNKVDYFIEFAQ